MNELDVLQCIHDEPSKILKINILKSNNGNSRFSALINAALNYNRVYGINKIDLCADGISIKSEVDLHDEFMLLLYDLENRAVVGNYARSRLNTFLSKCSNRQLIWYTRVLRKDLKAGFSAETAVEAGFDVPIFDVMLAKDGKSCSKLKEIVSKGVYASPKFDGYRCIAVINNGVVTLYSRSGTEFENFPSIVSSLERSFASSSLILDGEIMSDDFQAMQKSAFANKRGTTVGDVKYFVFGYIPYNEWMSKKFNMKTSDRLSALSEIKKSFEENIVCVDHRLINDLDEAYKFESECLSSGFEGAMLLPDIPYYLGKKSNKLLKLKTMQSQDCTVIGFYEGEFDSRNQDVLGGLEVMQENGVTCRCGSGFTDEDRRYIWNNMSDFLGRVVEIKHQELTKDGTMRFPIFVRWRNDKKIVEA